MTAFDPSNGLLFGAAFYDEYRVVGSLDDDLDLMKAAGFNVIRVGESVWSTWEPHPGQYELDWLEPVLDGAHARGIRVILGTPTYAVPAWLAQLDPSMAAQSATGQRVPWGSRQEIDYTNTVFRHHAEGVIRAILQRYAQHPAIIGFQVDNEPGLFLLHNDGVFRGFLDFLRERYETVEALNESWGLTYWSHRLNDWNDLWRPDGNHSPQYQLEWRRYQARVVESFIGWQADITREYAGSHQFVTTCISYERPAVDDEALASSLDVTAGNPYYKMQDALRIGVEVPRPEIWWSSGVWGLVQQGDRMWGSRQAPFLVTETNAQSIGQSHWQNHPPYPGQIAQAALTLISRGARMIEYWQWQTLHVGIETYWGGVLPHSGRPGRVYQEVAELGRRLPAIASALEGYVPDADVAFLYSTDTKRSFEFYPPLADASGGPDAHSYMRIFDAFYRPAVEAGRQARILHPGQIRDYGLDALVRDFPVLVVPTLYIAADDDLQLLADYSEAGGHLVVGPRTGYGDELARARASVAPSVLAHPAGVTYDEYSSLDEPVVVTGPLGSGLATGWADALEVGDADVMASYRSGIYRSRAAVTSRQHGKGRVTYVGTVPNGELGVELLRWVVPQFLLEGWIVDPGVLVSSGMTRSGRVWMVFNFSPQAATVRPPHPVVDVENFHGLETTLAMEPWAVRVFTADTN